MRFLTITTYVVFSTVLAFSGYIVLYGSWLPARLLWATIFLLIAYDLLKIFMVNVKVSRKTQLTRYYLFNSKWLGVKLHHIHGEDKWHTHPWHGISIIVGSYEEDLGSGFKLKRFFNYIGPRRRHRVRGRVWTIFIHGPRVNSKWEWDGVVAPFRGPDN